MSPRLFKEVFLFTSESSSFIKYCRLEYLGKTSLGTKMGAKNVKPEVPSNEKKLKPCCACPETKKLRDACIIEKGEENCKDLIEAHKECMRKHGFKI